MWKCENVREQKVLQVYAVKPDCEQSLPIAIGIRDGNVKTCQPDTHPDDSGRTGHSGGCS